MFRGRFVTATTDRPLKASSDSLNSDVYRQRQLTLMELLGRFFIIRPR